MLHFPEPCQRAGQAQGHLFLLSRLSCYPPPQGRAQIALLAREVLLPEVLLGTVQIGLCLLCQRQVVRRMSPPENLHLLIDRKPLPGILTYRLQQQQAWFGAFLFELVHQAFVQQRRDGIEHGDLRRVKRATQRLRRAQGAAANEDGKPPEEAPLPGTQQIITPLQGGTQRALALREIVYTSA